MGDAARYLDELDAKATAWETRVQIACAQAIVEAINEQTERLMGVPTREALLAPAPDAVREAAERLRADDVEWVVNSLGELGVKIGDQFFFLYKGESLVYRHDDDEDGPLLWRHVGKREFGECCHPINYADPTRYGTVDVNDGREWRPLLAALDARRRG